MADWDFNGIDRIIKEPNVGSGNLTWSVERDIYSAWKRWAQDNAQFEPAFTVEGGVGLRNTAQQASQYKHRSNEHFQFPPGGQCRSKTGDVRI